MHLHGRRTGVVAQLPDGMVVLSVKPGQLANTARALRVRPHPAWGVPRPADAVVREGADAYVFRVNGKLFERVGVAVDHLDARVAVIKNDGTLTPGFDVVARNQAYQLNLELKKGQAGGGSGHAHGHEH